MPATVSMHELKLYIPPFHVRQIPLCMQYCSCRFSVSPMCKLPWVKLSGPRTLQSWNISVPEQCWPVAALQCLTRCLEVRLKMGSTPAVGSALNSLDLVGCWDSLVSRCWICAVAPGGLLGSGLPCGQPVPARVKPWHGSAPCGCAIPQRCSCSLRSCEASSVCCWEGASPRKLLLHLNLKAVLFLIWWERHSHSLLPGFGVITSSDCLKLPSGADCITAPVSPKLCSCTDSP